MGKVYVWEEDVVIPTYEIGEAEKNPIFLDKRVYQGSSGKVYPYPTVESVSDVKTNKVYKAVYLENDYIKVMILPQLGGRIQRAYDKTNDYDFVYYNHVIKPALVGLTGPWISGGIEFNWPQHHRPTTFLPVDYILAENEDGSKSVLVHDVDQMYGTKGIAKFTLYPDRAYIEITGQLYNRTPLPQTFLWWANPAVSVNEYTQSIFPPDVHAVMDHGKRDVSRFPIATGVYYKKDYSEGVDISRYKNIPVPTSYMAEKSKYDFVGGYDYHKQAGILHVADHHISPGKKQWTWGCGDFGQAWDRNLTDTDGPYIELMTGVYTDNQPDFTWLKPFEEKTFKQYFMPYKAVGQVKNATIDAAVNLTVNDENIEVIVYATGKHESEVTLTYDGEIIWKEAAKLSPNDVLKKEILYRAKDQTKLTVKVTEGEQILVEYTPEVAEIEKLPEPAKEPQEPKNVQTNEELYLIGMHLEQYRHATYSPDDYYLEALKRDCGDIRVNNAYGMLLMRRGCFKEAITHFETAIKRMTWRNPNPYQSEAYYNLGLAQFYLGNETQAYDNFFKATWSNEQQEMSFYYLAVLDARKKNYVHALEMIEKGLIKNSHNIKARGLKAYLLRKSGKIQMAKSLIKENLELDAFDYVSGYEQLALMADSDIEEKKILKQQLVRKMRDFTQNHLMTARDYAEFGAYDEAIQILNMCTNKFPLLKYYEAYYRECQCSQSSIQNEKIDELLNQAENMSTDYCFPNKLEDIFVLEFAIKRNNAGMAAYYLGNLYYDKKQWEKAIELWEFARDKYPKFSIVHRNLALAYYNKRQDKENAKKALEQAFKCNPKDARLFLELDQLYKKLNVSFEKRLCRFEEYMELVESRDDLYIEYITLQNATGNYEKAYELMKNRQFHAWEGGEGKITTQYVISLLFMAKKELAKANPIKAQELLEKALVYPHNLGEGKLEGTKDNHIYYYLGEALEMRNKKKEAFECYERASIGTDEPAGMMYYNDQPADMILYQGLANLKLGKKAEANSRFYRLIDYGEKHIFDEVKVEYFAVSLPDFLIFEDDLTIKNRAHCYYLMALGNWGIGKRQKARDFINKAAEQEPSHLQIKLYKDEWEQEENL